MCSHTETASTGPATFGDLAAELRYGIYELYIHSYPSSAHVLRVEDASVTAPALQFNHPWVKLLLARKQIYEEAAPICKEAGRLDIWLQNVWVNCDTLRNVLMHLGAPHPASQSASLYKPSMDSLRHVRLNLRLDTPAGGDPVMDRFDVTPLMLLPNLEILEVPLAGGYPFDEPLQGQLMKMLATSFGEKVDIVHSEWPIPGYASMSQADRRSWVEDATRDWYVAQSWFKFILYHMQTESEGETAESVQA